MADNKYTEFKDECLIPTLLSSHLDTAFPEMEFKDRGNRWISRYHLNGSVSHSKDQTYIYKGGTTLCDQNGEKMGIVDFAMRHYDRGFVETLQELAAICGLSMPEQDREYTQQMRQNKARQDALIESHTKQVDILFSTEGEQVLRYLTEERGYSESLIRKMRLGCLNNDEARRLNEIGEELPYNILDFPLSIPYFSKNRIRGFKFRYISLEAAQKHGKGKYRNTKTLSGKMNSFPYLFNPAKIKEELIIVEGELDALHIYAEGIENVVATSGGSLSEETVSILSEVETLKRVIFIPDNDKDGRGNKFVRDAIQEIDRLGLISLVATLPNGYKDADEYLSKNSIENLKNIIEQADKAPIWEYKILIQEAQEKYPEDNLSGKHAAELEDAVFTLYNSTREEQVKAQILEHFAGFYGNISDAKSALMARANHIKALEDERLRATETKQAAAAIGKLVEEGKITEALSLMGDTHQALKQIGAKDKYSHLLLSQNLESLAERIRNKPKDIPTRYEFTEPNDNKKELLTLPPGALTFIVAQTSHGKSTFLQNIALQVAETEEEGTVLYFTYEEEADSVTLQLLNKCIGTPISDNNKDSIESYFREGTDRYVKTDALPKFHKGLDKFSRLLAEKKLQVFYVNYDSTELASVIRYISKEYKVKAVFIDYIQFMRKNGNRKQRTEEVKDICIELKDLCVETQLPIIVGAQANREVTSPLEMHSQRIAEAADLERIANKIVFIWNSHFSAQKSKDSKSELEEFEQRTGVTIGKDGKIYAKLTKNRGGRVNIEAVLEYNGNTGVIMPNYEPKPEQGNLSFPGEEQGNKLSF